MEVVGLLVNAVTVGIISNGWSRLFGDGNFSSAMLETFFGGAFERLTGNLSGNEAYQDAVRAAQKTINDTLDRHRFDTQSREGVGKAVSTLLVPFLMEAERAMAAGYVPDAIAAQAIAANPHTVEGLTADQKVACREVLSAALATGLSNRKHLTSIEAKFRAAVLKGLSDLPTELRTFALRLQAASLLSPHTPKPYLGRDFESAAVLLDARFGALELLGRDVLLADFDGWRERDGIGIRLVVGPGGIGKTRLGMELCRRAETSGWRAGFLDSAAKDVPTEVWPLLLNNPKSLLIVVDYAETRRRELERLCEALAAVHRPGGPRIRVVLIARAAGDWWERRASWGGEGVSGFVSSRAVQHAPIDLTQEPELPAATIFRAAAGAFMEALGGGQSLGVAEPDLTAGLYRLPLLVRIAALHGVEAALTGGSSPEPDVLDSEDKLLDWTIERERRLSRVHGGFEEEHELEELADATAFVTLTGGTDEISAVSFLARVPSLAEQNGGQRKRVAHWLARLYPGPRFLNPMIPDRLGERMAALRMERHGNPAKGANPLLSAALGDGAGEAERYHALTVLNRLASRVPAEARWLDRAFADHLAACAEPALAVAIQMPELIGPALERVFTERQELEVAKRIVNKLPERTVALAGLAQVVTEQLVGFLLKVDNPSDKYQSILAGMLNNLANRYRALGRHKEALAVSERAVAIRRELARVQPDAFRHSLAIALNNLAAHLRDVNRLKEALTTVKEALRLYKELTRSQPDSFRPAVGETLNNLAIHLRDVGNHRRALTAAKCSMKIYQELANSKPDIFQPALGIVLISLSNSFSNLGHRKEALAVAEEAEGLFRELEKVQSDVFLPDLAASLNNLSNHFHGLDRHEEALAAAEEAVQLFRTLAGGRPDAFRLPLSQALGGLGAALRINGDLLKAAASFREGIENLAPLFLRHPDAYINVMAGLLQSYVQTCKETDQAPDAILLNSIEEILALKIRQNGGGDQGGVTP